MQKPPVTYSSDSLLSTGMGHVVVARFKSGGRVELGVFLLDTYCLGVKNAFFHACDEAELADLLDRFFSSSGELEEHSGAWGRKLVEGAAAYARRLGFAPHRHYKRAARVLGGIDPKACTDTFVFGQNGKPFFIAGPNDTPARCRLIISVLTKKVGADGFHFTMPANHDEFAAFFDEDEDEDEAEADEDEDDDDAAEAEEDEKK